MVMEHCLSDLDTEERFGRLTGLVTLKPNELHYNMYLKREGGWHGGKAILDYDFYIFGKHPFTLE